MKSILVGKSDTNKIYFIVDSIHPDADCVIKNKIGDVTVENFWEYIDNHPQTQKILNTKFHEYLWNGHQSKTNIHWYSIFVSKSLPIREELLTGAIIVKDVLQRQAKSLEFENRAMDFVLAKNTGQWSRKMVANWIEAPEQKFKKGKRKKKSKNG